MTKQIKELRLPDLFTTIGLGCALASLFCSFLLLFDFAYFLLLGQFIFDCIDGRVARKFGKGKLGIYLDSFSDFTAIIGVVVFGWFVGMQGIFMFLASFFFLSAAAIRLSYFTVRSHQKITEFIGIPTVLCVVLVATTIIINYHFQIINMKWLVILYFVFAYAMVSNIEFKKI